MATPIDINDVLTGLMALFGGVIATDRVVKIFNRKNASKIDTNKELSENADERTVEKVHHSEDMVKLLISTNEKYFNEKFDAQNAKFDTFSKDIKKIVDKHDNKIEVHTEAITRHDERLNHIENTLKTIDKRSD